MRVPEVARLLNQVSALARTQRKVNLLSGENFNVFRILKLESNEVRTHSAFLGELLNPAGSHGLGDAFLRLFIKTVNVPEFEPKGAKLRIEYPVGRINDGYDLGGRVDLYLESAAGDQCIMIENKIYAGDQPNQLARYCAYKPTAKLLYLTLDGSAPSEEATGRLSPADYQLCSYGKDIAKWLEGCCLAASAYPLVRETLRQYLNLINYLTGNTPQNFMHAETKQLLLSDLASFESAAHCRNVFEHIQQETTARLKEALFAAWETSFPNPIILALKYRIRLGVGCDRDGFHYSFRVTTLEGDDAPTEVVTQLVALIKSINHGFKSNNYNFGWRLFHASGLGHFERLPVEVQFQHANNISALVEAMIAEAAVDRHKLLSRLAEVVC
ncbi:PD-(D/E)XK nuclease family protein [Solirubrum puertoriconensis]|uniref:PD-(D/E)XK nuclease superfamily protein n=1 Tax=Solirubrum puertoriconensis TaxID=1751427 RepID=A0A9X0HNF5_SOLP1|nr:PD-(D/E)XK nuclease family protein [Solirubrum puertoriconensis]KUG09118.1 hypothetical protein ASU33_20080 [Solirubrum puertoriconensis]